MLNIFYGLPGGIGASAAAGGAAAVIGFPVGAGQVPVEDGHQENYPPGPEEVRGPMSARTASAKARGCS